jgi:hypothetical protein
MTARRRVQFILPRQTIAKLDRIKDATGASSRTEVLKISIELLDWAVTHLAKGEEIAAVRDREIEETIALPGVGPRINTKRRG